MDAPAITASWLGRMPYREAWTLQKELVAERAAGAIGDRLLLLEHPAVLTIGKHGDAGHVLAPAAELDRRGIEVVRVERGGEVTYHGPGQLVAYPILRLADRGLLVRPLVRALEAAIIETCTAYGIAAGRRDGEPGCWIAGDSPFPRKIGALGLRIEHGVSYHGIALNVDPRLEDFELIDPCGMPGLVSTSIARELGRSLTPEPVGEEATDAEDRLVATTEVVEAVGRVFADALGRQLGSVIDWSSSGPSRRPALAVG